MYWLLIALLILLPQIILFPYMGDFLYQPGSAYSDLLISHVPNLIVLQQSLFEKIQLPFWSPSILSGYPFAANPLSGLWYLPGWLGMVLPMPIGLNLLFSFHLMWGAVGLYRFLRCEQLAIPAALLGALIFEMLPKLWSHYFAGHITMIFAVAWTPWLLLAEKKWKENSNHRRYLFAPGVILGIIFLTDVRWAAVAGVLWFAYATLHETPSSLLDKNTAKIQLHITWIRKILDEFLRIFKKVTFQICLAFLIAAPLGIPLLEFARLSTRSELTSGDILALSLPPMRLMGLLVPRPGDYAEWVLYPSSVALILALLSISIKEVRKRSLFWIWMALLSLIFSLGSAIPGLTWLVQIPGFDLLRVPPRMLLVTGFCLAILAAYGLDMLLGSYPEKNLNPKRHSYLSIIVLIEIVLLFTIAVGWMERSFPFLYAITSLWMIMAAILVVLRLRGRVSALFLVMGIFSVCLLDLTIVNRLSFQPRNPTSVFSEGETLASYLQNKPQPFRVYSPSYSLPQHTAARYELQLADGVDPLQLKGYSALMERATGVPTNGYSVTLPPFASGDPKTDNQPYLPNPQLLGLLNVRYISSEYEIQQEGLSLIARFGDTRLYENIYQYPRAWMQLPTEAIGKDIRPVQVVSWTPEHILLSAEGPGLLVLSEINYPGWQAWVDGERTEIPTAPGLLRRVLLGSGSHMVEFIFRPFTAYIGIILAVCTWLGLIVTYLLFWRMKRW
jgi:hypothetical protein